MTEIKCPGCDLVLTEDDLYGQSEHMKQDHPEIVAERLAEEAAWDGWEDS